MTTNTDPVRALIALAERAVPFLLDEAANYDDDGSNEPLELVRDIESLMASLSSDESALPSANSAFDGGREAALASAPPSGGGSSESDAVLLARLGDDAQKWAQEFRATAIKLGYSDMDEGWLIGWFANAIEHSSDVRRWRAEAAPPSAPGLLADLETIWHSVSDDGETNAAYQRLQAALAQQPAAVNEAMMEEANEQRAIAAYEKYMGVSADDPAYGPDLTQWMAGWNAALAAQQQGGRADG